MTSKRCILAILSLKIYTTTTMLIKRKVKLSEYPMLALGHLKNLQLFNSTRLLDIGLASKVKIVMFKCLNKLIKIKNLAKKIQSKQLI